MRVHIFGARGSIPAPGPSFVRYGGETACVGISTGGRPPNLLIDAGTGIRNARDVLTAPYRGSILLGHLHWDHIMGLPFFDAGDRQGSEVSVLMPAQGHAEDVLGGLMCPPYFPICPRDLLGDWTFEAIEAGEHNVEGYSVLAVEVPHRGGRTFGFRISDGVSTVAYISDHDPTTGVAGPHPDDLLTLTAGVDLLIHDAQYTAAEHLDKQRFGHSSIEYAVGLAEASGCRGLLLFHHDPSRTDDEIDALLNGLVPSPVDIRAAVEGSVIDLPGRGDPLMTVETVTEQTSAAARSMGG